MLATVDQLKIRNGIAATDTDHDEVFSQILAGVSDRLARVAGRIYDGKPVLEKSSLTVYLSVGDYGVEDLWLPAWPVVSVTSIKEAVYEDFDSVDALTALSEYQIDNGTGRLHRIGFWLQGMRTVKVAYTGGYTAAGEIPGTGETELPQDIVEAALQQASFIWQRRDQLGLSGQAAQGGSISMYARDTLLPEVRDTMASYARCIG